MAAFLVFTRISTKDQAEMDRYAGLAGASMKGHAVTPLAAYGAHQVLEGSAHEGMVILSFPDADAARAWYDSPAYTAARQHRLAGADYDCTLVEGL